MIGFFFVNCEDESTEFDDSVLGGGAGQLVEFGAIVEDVVADLCDVGGKGEEGEDFTTRESSAFQFGGVWGEGY